MLGNGWMTCGKRESTHYATVLVEDVGVNGWMVCGEGEDMRVVVSVEDVWGAGGWFERVLWNPEQKCDIIYMK